MLCAYRSIFGDPGAGAHRHRVFGLAAVDVAGTLALAWTVRRASGLSFAVALAAVWALGIALHRLFCVRTTVDALLFPDDCVT